MESAVNSASIMELLSVMIRWHQHITNGDMRTDARLNLAVAGSEHHFNMQHLVFCSPSRQGDL